MNHISEFADLSEDEIERLTDRSVTYITEGRLDLPALTLGSAPTWHDAASREASRPEAMTFDNKFPQARPAGSLTVALRWMAVLPAAALAAWAAWIVVNLLNRLTFFVQGLNPDSLLSRAFIEGAAHADMGAAGVYAGAKVAPSHRKIVVFLLAGLIILGGGFALFPAILVRNGWAIYGAIWLVIGAGSVAWGVYSGGTREFDD
jgi:hypothetical protein